MSGVFRNITPYPTPSPPGECVPPAFGAGVGHTRWWRGGGAVNSSEDARHCSVLYICKYFGGEYKYYLTFYFSVIVSTCGGGAVSLPLRSWSQPTVPPKATTNRKRMQAPNMFILSEAVSGKLPFYFSFLLKKIKIAK
jgi:hypothetical protein